MEKDKNIKLFQNKEIATVWNSEEEDWYFSVVDVVDVLTNSENPRKYWSVLKTRLKTEGSAVIFSVPVDDMVGIGRFDGEITEED